MPYRRMSQASWSAMSTQPCANDWARFHPRQHLLRLLDLHSPSQNLHNACVMLQHGLAHPVNTLLPSCTIPAHPAHCQEHRHRLVVHLYLHAREEAMWLQPCRWRARCGPRACVLPGAIHRTGCGRSARSPQAE
uniref:Uncharacterized protein n=1 Tax=Arundo donax TaxID=35708 RepID=A0A0A9HN94_ARUDO